MATIRSQMVLNDGISGVLRKINTALNTTLNAFEQVQRASGRAVDTAQIQAARAALVQANREVDEMAEGYRRAAEQEEILNKGLRNGTNAAGGLLGKVKGIVATLAAGAGIKALLGLSDKLTSTTARLNFLVDDGGLCGGPGAENHGLCPEVPVRLPGHRLRHRQHGLQCRAGF